MATTSVPSSGGDDTNSGAAAPAASVPAQTGNQPQSAAAGAETAAQQLEKKKEVWVRFCLWFALSVIFALLPTIGQYLNGRQTAGFHQPGLMEWVSKAQLYIVSMGLAVTALGEALMHLRKAQSFRLVLVTIGNVLILAIATYLAPTADSDTTIKAVVGQQSLVIFIAALVTSGCSTWLCSSGVGVDE